MLTGIKTKDSSELVGFLKLPVELLKAVQILIII